MVVKRDKFGWIVLAGYTLALFLLAKKEETPTCLYLTV